MSIIHNIATFIYDNAGWFIFTVFNIILFILMFQKYFDLWWKNKMLKKIWEDKNVYYSIAEKGTDRIGILVDKRTLAPVFVTENIKTILGLEQSEVLNNIEALGRCMGETEWRGFWRSCRDHTAKDNSVVFEKNDQVYELKVTECGEEYELWHIVCITKIKHYIDDLEKRLSLAAEESQTKTTFLSRMSHEIRTPMNGIIGMLTLAGNQIEKDEQVRPYLQKAGELSGYLLSLINDILDMSRIEAGKIELEDSVFDLYAMGQKYQDMFQKNIEAKGVRWKLEYQNVDERYLIGDELRLSQVIVNFLSNAQKFTSEGEITVTFRQMMKVGDKVDLMIRVHDTGIGMDVKFLNHIFKPFEQESVGITKSYGGSGLGMAISDQIIRLMGGEIVVDSKVGVGSNFTVFVRLKIADEAMAGQQAESNAPENTYTFEGCTILMAEDNMINEEIATEILGEMGARVDVAHDGQEVIDMFEKSDINYYDFILMDVQMPVMDGRSAAKKIRLLSRIDAGSIPIFALSADAFVEDERKSRDAGMNGHFSKPIDFEKMQKDIGAYMQRKK